MRLLKSLLVATVCSAVLAPLSASADTGSWKDPARDVRFPSADVTRFDLNNSIEGVVFLVFVAEDSTATRRQSALRTEIDVTEDGKPDFVVSTQAPYREGTVETLRGRQLCEADAGYQARRGGAMISIGIPGDCVQFPLRVSAAHTFLVSSDEERAVDRFGSLDKQVARPLVPAYAFAAVRRGKPVVSLVADPSFAGTRAVVQVQRGRSWVTVGRAVISPDGEAAFRVSPASLKRGMKGRVVWEGRAQAAFRAH